mmetsp:Transcript_35376/g.77559  ORF Transcript_35376/g.77559 Transcript_35376/m.77559 type:complete len:920 (-) Transcript_35376:49-2808(-)
MEESQPSSQSEALSSPAAAAAAASAASAAASDDEEDSSSASVLPYDYYDNLRLSPTATFVPLVAPNEPGFAGGRNLYRAIDPDSPPAHSPGVILCHIPTYLRWTQLDQANYRLVDASNGGYDGMAGVLLAMHHFNNGIGAVVKDLDGINNRCSIRLTTESFDTMGFDLAANVHLFDSVLNTEFDDATDPQMGAIIGTTTSDVSTSMASQSGIFDLPQFSPSATSTLLDNSYQYPLFSRTIASDAATAARLTGYLQTELNVTYFGMVYVNDAYGGSFQQDVRQWATLRRMQLYAFPIEPGAAYYEIIDALTFLQEKKVNYIVGTFYPDVYEDIMGPAYEMGMAGAGKVWFFSASLGPVFLDGSAAALESGSSAALATPGNALLHDEGGLPGFPQYDLFLEEWRRLGADDEALEYFNSKTPEWKYHFYFTNETLASNRNWGYFSLRNPSFVAAYAYDAAVALGLGACAAQANIDVGDLTVPPMDANSTFTGASHFYNSILSDFLGASGRVRFGSDGSNSRDGNSTYFVVSNIRRGQSTNGSTTFRGVPTSYYDIATDQWTSYRNRTFIYSGNTGDELGSTTIPPRDLPPPNTTLVHLSPAAKGVAFSLCALGLLASTFCFAFTMSKRRHRIIRASQPEFLALVCAGCFLMASAIIPLSIDNTVASDHGCSIACMARFWLVSCGFCLTFSALFSKLWRINRVMKNAKGFKKVKVTPMDVAIPGAVLLGCNLIVLIVWTIVSPFSWEIETLSTDEYGRPLVQIGNCKSDNVQAYVASLLAIDGIAIVITLWQAYVARNISTDLSESKYIALSVTAIFEATFIGVPVLYIVSAQPSAVLFLSSAIIFVSVAAILGFIFFPKYFAWKTDKRLAANSSEPGARAFRRSSREMERLKSEVARLTKEIEDLKMGAQETASMTELGDHD